jgi:hypothetical protein
VIKQHSSDHKLHFSSDTLQNRIPFLKKMERNLHISQLKPKVILVNLNGGGKANVAVFNLKAMILSLLLDDNLMRPKNIAEGYDIFTGNEVSQMMFMVKSTLVMHGNQLVNIFAVMIHAISQWH